MTTEIYARKLEKIREWANAEIKGKGSADEQQFSFGFVSGIIEAQNAVKKILNQKEILK